MWVLFMGCERQTGWDLFNMCALKHVYDTSNFCIRSQNCKWRIQKLDLNLSLKLKAVLLLVLIVIVHFPAVCQLECHWAKNRKKEKERNRNAKYTHIAYVNIVKNVSDFTVEQGNAWFMKHSRRLSTVISGQGRPTFAYVYSIKDCVVTSIRECAKTKENWLQDIKLG